MSSVFISIASYRDPDVVNTVRSCYDNAISKDNLFFSVFSQAEDGEHPDLSFIPENQLRLTKAHWSESLGACWARDIATKDINRKYFLQIDSHSRFVLGWDQQIIGNYERAEAFWGPRVMLTNYPDPFEIDWSTEPPTDNLIGYPQLKSLKAVWHQQSRMIQAQPDWPAVIDTVNGDEHFFFSANSVFCNSDLMREVPYDKELYFTGEEPSMALRAYTRGIRLVSPTVKYMFTNYNRENSKRELHWENHETWWELNRQSYRRLEKIMKGDKSLGIFGIDSESLYQQYQKLIDVDLKAQDFNI